MIENYGKEGFTKADYASAIKEWKLRLVGSPEINDMNDPDIASKVKYVEERCRDFYSRMNKEGNPVILWGNSKPVESEELSRQYAGLRILACGWGTYGCEFYHDEQLLKAILFGLEWMYKNMYGEAEKRNEGWRDIYACNWWFWYIGAPEHFTDIFIIIEEHLSRDDIRRYVSLHEWMRNDPKAKTKSTTANIEAKLGILLEDVERLRWCNESVHKSMEITEQGKVRKDFTHWWHNFPHNMTYGVEQNLARPLFVSSILAPTALRLTSPRKYNQYLMLKYMFEPAMYHGRGFFMLSGRQTAGKEYEKGGKTLALLLSMIGVYGKEEDFYIKRFIKSSAKDENVVKEIKKTAPIYDLALFNSIFCDPEIPDTVDYEYAHAWHTGDRATQHRNGYAIGISLSSLREIAFESILGLNKRGWYTADGATYLYTDYDVNAYDGDNFITKNKEIAHRIPGTTEDERERVPRSITGPWAWKNPSDFAGSMQIDDKYIVAAMEFVSMHYEGADDVVDEGYGGGPAPHSNDLRAKKAYFCFDKEIVCLGADITSTMDSPVNTIVEHKRIVDDVKYTQYLDGKALPKSDFEEVREGRSCFFMQGHSAFVNLGSEKALCKRYISESEQPFIEYRICHGKNPSGATYSYAILPHAELEFAEEYSKNPEIEILSNTPSVAAVKKEGLGITGYVFYEAMQLDGIAVSAPAIVTKTERDGVVSLRVCEPTQKLEAMTLTLDNEYTVKCAHERISAVSNEGKTVINIDFRESYGEAYELNF